MRRGDGGVSAPKRFPGSVTLDSTRVGRDAGRVADEGIAHLVGLVGSKIMVMLEIEAEIPTGARGDRDSGSDLCVCGRGG